MGRMLALDADLVGRWFDRVRRPDPAVHARWGIRPSAQEREVLDEGGIALACAVRDLPAPAPVVPLTEPAAELLRGYLSGLAAGISEARRLLVSETSADLMGGLDPGSAVSGGLALAAGLNAGAVVVVERDWAAGACPPRNAVGGCGHSDDDRARRPDHADSNAGVRLDSAGDDSIGHGAADAGGIDRPVGVLHPAARGGDRRGLSPAAADSASAGAAHVAIRQRPSGRRHARLDANGTTGACRGHHRVRRGVGAAAGRGAIHPGVRAVPRSDATHDRVAGRSPRRR